MRDRCCVFGLLCAVALVAGACTAADELPYNGGSMPAGAAPGECWCLYTIPAQYETKEYRVCVTPESKRRIEIPAEYRTEEYRVCVKKEEKCKEKIPAVYETRQETVCCKKESKRKVKIPAVYRDEEYTVCVEPARTEWRRTDCGVNTSADMKMEAGECYCLVTIPARHETRTRKVCVEKERCIEECIPAEFKTVEKKVCVQKERCTEHVIPAVYETRTRQVCCKKASCTFETIPAVYETRTKQVCVAPARKVWRRTDCNAPIPASYQPAAPAPLPAPVSFAKDCGSCETKCSCCPPLPDAFDYDSMPDIRFCGNPNNRNDFR